MLSELLNIVKLMPKWFWYIVFFSYGAVIGSFNNVLIYRLPREMSIVYPPSHCPHCKRPLKPWHNIPIVSYLILRGRCAYCGTPIPIRYLIVELITALSFTFTFHLFGFSLETLKWVLFWAIAIPIAFIDWEWQIIPDELNVAMALSGALYLTLKSYATASLIPLQLGILNAILLFLIFYAIYYLGKLVFKKEALGFGDVKLAFGLGLLFERIELVLLAIMLSFTLGAFIGGVIFIFKCLKERKFQISPELWSLGLLAIPMGWLIREYLLYEEDVRGSFYIAFGPFMLLGAWISGMWGYHIIDWYMRAILGF